MAVISDKIPGPLQGMGDHQIIEEGSIFLPHLHTTLKCMNIPSGITCSSLGMIEQYWSIINQTLYSSSITVSSSSWASAILLWKRSKDVKSSRIIVGNILACKNSTATLSDNFTKRNFPSGNFQSGFSLFFSELRSSIEDNSHNLLSLKQVGQVSS